MATDALNLDGIVFEGLPLKIKRTNEFIAIEDPTSPIIPSKISTVSDGTTPTRVILIKNMASLSDLSNDVFYKELFEDIQSAALQFGPIITTIIPKPPILKLV